MPCRTGGDGTTICSPCFSPEGAGGSVGILYGFEVRCCTHCLTVLRFNVRSALPPCFVVYSLVNR